MEIDVNDLSPESIVKAPADFQEVMKCDLPENYIPSENEPYMNPRQLEYFSQRLLQWHEQILSESMATLDQLKKESLKEMDFVDQGFQEMNTSLKLRSRDRSLNLVRKIDEALEKIENGTYGYCDETGEEIGLKRLEARPIATLSLEAQEWKERQKMRI